MTLCGRAAVRLAMDRIPDAQRDCEAALDHLAWLIAEQTRKGAPENPQYLSLLGQVLAQQSRIHFLQGRSPEGRKHPRRSGRKTEPGHRARPRTGGGQGEARTNQSRPGSVGKVNRSGRDDDNSLPGAIRADALVLYVGCTQALWPARVPAPRGSSKPADRSCLRSRASKHGRYFRLMELRGMMELPLGVCPDGARTIPDLRTAYGWLRARPWVAAAGVLPHPGALRRIQALEGDSGVWLPPLRRRLRGLAGGSNGRR